MTTTVTFEPYPEIIEKYANKIVEANGDFEKIKEVIKETLQFGHECGERNTYLMRSGGI